MSERFAFAPAIPVLRPLLPLLMAGRGRARVEVSSAAIRVRFGVGFSATIPLASVRRAEPDTDPVLGWGVHGFRGRWLVNTSSRGLVSVHLDPVPRGRVLGVPVRLHRLRLSLAEPDRFLAAVNRGRA